LGEIDTGAQLGLLVFVLLINLQVRERGTLKSRNSANPLQICEIGSDAGLREGRIKRGGLGEGGGTGRKAAKKVFRTGEGGKDSNVREPQR